MTSVGGEEDDHFQQKDAVCETALQRKHKAMVTRLAANRDAQLQKSSVRRAGTAEGASPLESVDRFLQTFSERRQQVEVSLSDIQERKSCLLSEDDNSSIRTDLEKLEGEVSEIGKFLAEKSYFLPAYEVRICQSIIASLRDQVEAAKVEIIPKKKFSFKNKTGKARKAVEAESRIINTTSSTEDMAKPRQDSSFLRSSVTRSTCGIQDIQNKIVVRDLMDQEDGECMLQNLVNCTVYIRGLCQALYIHKLKDCHVYTGPISGSVLIEEVEKSVLMLAAHQIRIHQVKTTDFYLRVRSRPIVEYTSDVRFAPYAFYYHGIEDDLRAANLLEETGLWENVDDFRWLRAIASPNWSVLPEDQRLPLVEVGLHSPQDNDYNRSS